MAEFADSFLKNLGIHASPLLASTPATQLSDRLGQLGDTLRYARTSLSLASLSQALIGTTSTHSSSNGTPRKDLSSPIPPAPEQAKGRLSVNVVEARNLTVVDPSKADIYCLVQYDANVMSTLDVPDQSDSPTSIPIPNASRNNYHVSSTQQSKPVNVFQLAMEASCPKWRYTATL